MEGCGAGLLQAGRGYEAEGDGFHDHVGGVGGPELAHDVAAVLRVLSGRGGSIRTRFCCRRRFVTAVVVWERSVTAVAARDVFVLGIVRGISA